MGNDKEAVMEEALKNTCQMAPLSFVLMMRTSGEDPLWRMEHSAYRKVIKLWGSTFHKYKRIWSDFRILPWCPSKTGTAYGK